MQISEKLTSSKKMNLMVIVGALVVIVLGVVWLMTKNYVPVLPDPPLRELAEQRGMDIGNHAIYIKFKETPYKEILTQEFNLALIDNTPNWYFTDGGLRPSRDEYYFEQMDEIVDFAEQNNMAIQAHHYLWGEEKWLPDWLKNGNYTRDELDQIIKEHIQEVGSRYSGRIKEWTVVNEAFSRGQNLYGLRDWWGDATGGKEYIDKAFLYARQADPKSKLILNDFGNEGMNDVSNEMYEYIKDALKRGVPIDGIGMQMHIDGTHPPTKDEVLSNMKRFGELGIGVYVTEFDVNMNDVKAIDENKDKIEGDIYYEMARACIESEYCKSFAILGISDEETWYSHMGLENPRPLPFDKNYQPKPAYYSLRTAFEQP